MIPEPLDPSADYFLSFAIRWFRLLAMGDAAGACALLDEPNSYGCVWTPDLLRKTLAEAYDFGMDDLVTAPTDTPQAGRTSLIALRDGSGYSFDCPVPINGTWSDLTAQFEFLRRPPNQLAVVLHDLHVL